jgi:cytochrome oxidase assembly protein ShyY1
MIKKFGWIIGYVGLLILFLRLGIWQLNRADEKEQFLSNQADWMKSS